MPTSMFTLTSWFSFLLPPTSYPARTSLLVTIFLCQVLFSRFIKSYRKCYPFLYPDILPLSFLWFYSRPCIQLSFDVLSYSFSCPCILPPHQNPIGAIFICYGILLCPGGWRWLAHLILVHLLQIGIFNAVIKDTPNENGGKLVWTERGMHV